MGSGEIQRSETANRELGKQLVDQLSELPAKLNGPLTQEQLQDNTVQLMNLSDWCAATEGYGNLLLARRCLDLACIPLLRMVADLRVPVAQYEPLLKRLSPKWMSVETRRRVLNQEAGVELFHDSDNTNEKLDIVWRLGYEAKRELEDPSRKERRKGNPLGNRLDNSPEIYANVKFFIDDRAGGVLTTTNSWEHKFHEIFIVGLDVPLADEVRALAEFRAVVGKFPTEDNPKSFYRGGEGAFEEAWRPTVQKLPGMTREQWNRRRSQFVVAWRAYASVLRGEILDMDSSMLNAGKRKQSGSSGSAPHNLRH
ncbi:MAG: hypothetical protein PCFJNLEI_04117 [Verrucomicrobiae bacterium]|nr:hypothetical protein [Verrucomicrobiae bacterium]